MSYLTEVDAIRDEIDVVQQFQAKIIKVLIGIQSRNDFVKYRAKRVGVELLLSEVGKNG